MTSKIKIFGPDFGNFFLPQMVLRELDQPEHARQGRAYVWATSAKAAAARLSEFNIGARPRDLRVAHDTTAQLLDQQHDWLDGTVLCLPLNGGGRVIELSEPTILDGTPPLRSYTMRHIGTLAHPRAVFVPSPDFEPVVTDAMVDAARNVLADYEETMPIREALAAALRAQRGAV